ADARPVTAASDWYSVGVMLYECLTGRLPFDGPVPRVLRDKQQYDPPPPAELAPDVPADLNLLCVDLLSRDPAARPDGADVLRRLGPVEMAAAPRPALPLGAGPPAPFVGRRAELAVLGEAYDRVRQGRAAVAHVRGRSGMGKTALVQHFLDGLAVWEQALVL